MSPSRDKTLHEKRKKASKRADKHQNFLEKSHKEINASVPESTTENKTDDLLTPTRLRNKPTVNYTAL